MSETAIQMRSFLACNHQTYVQDDLAIGAWPSSTDCQQTSHVPFNQMTSGEMLHPLHSLPCTHYTSDVATMKILYNYLHGSPCHAGLCTILLDTKHYRLIDQSFISKLRSHTEL